MYVCVYTQLHILKHKHTCFKWMHGFHFLKLIYFNWRLITLQYCSGFCHTFTWISHGCTCVPHLETLSHLPPHPIPQGHPSAPALRTLSHVLNLDWRSVSHMIIYMFQCYTGIKIAGRNTNNLRHADDTTLMAESE